MDLIDKLELIQKFPGALAGLLKDRGGADADEISLGSFIQDVAEDQFAVNEEGYLTATDGETYTIWWMPAPRSEWIEYDDVAYEKERAKKEGKVWPNHTIVRVYPDQFPSIFRWECSCGKKGKSTQAFVGEDVKSKATKSGYNHVRRAMRK